ncbi:MAG: hypothetical protein HUJ58_04580 [Erysipelotrichaceae bacterium]|nr:hypothetical protein [Erysipelotrichaceae bacterium]
MKKKLETITKKWHVIIIVAIFVLISLLSWASSVISMGKYISTKVSDYRYGSVEEKDTVLNIVDREIENISSKWSTYGTKKFSKIDAFFTYYMTGEIASSQVLLGNDGWLFYQSKTDGDSIADFKGTNMYTSRQLESMAQETLNVQNKLESMGIRFALFVPPNKENVYFEKMPENYIHCEKTRTDILVSYLQENSINAISPKNNLVENSSNTQVYYSYDTHWNQLGAYIGVKDVLSTWDINIPDLSARNILKQPLNGNYHYGGEDDLAKMVGLLSLFDDEIEYSIEGTTSIDWEVYGEEQDSNIISHIHNDNASHMKTLFLVGDSFRTSMIPALSEVFSDVYVVHRSYYKPDMLESIKPDYLIAEYIERYSYAIEDIGFLVDGNK